MDATRPTEVPVPEPDLKPEEMIARARALRSMVREEAEAAERRGYYSEALHNEFVKAGFYRCLQPRRFGGYEFSIRTFFKTIIEIASGDPGIGWCLCLASGHALQIGSNFSEAAQAKIFGADGHFIAPYSPSGPSPDAECAAVPGGYRVKGKWRYASGVPYATHFMGMAPLRGSHPGGPTRKMVSIVVPRDQFEMLDDWHGMFGLKGSGSNSVVITDGLIPEDFVDETIFGDDGTGHLPGAKVHGNPMYNGIFMGFAPGELACSQVGAAWAALEEFEKHIRTTKPLLSAQAIFKYQHHDWQRIFGLALSMTHSAEAILLRSAELYVEYARGRTDGTGQFTGKEAMLLMGMQHQASRIAWEAGYDLFRASSTVSIRDGQPMQRFFRDFATFRNNPVHQPDFAATLIAQAYFGLPMQDFDF
jgi:3-hydroxy-9,10-secoandrosta-1,3,5(10)-triene-9,17-dione monooxygenase